MGRQYCACAFSASSRAYTYHWHGEPLHVGDEVVVTTDRGPSVVKVVSTSDEAPKFPTKPIVGKDRPPQPIADPVDADDLISPEDLF